MPTLFGVGPYRIVIFPNDHSPAHVHAVGPDGRAKVKLGRTPDDVSVIENDGLSKADLRRVVEQIVERHADCIRQWRHYHGKQEADRKGH